MYAVIETNKLCKEYYDFWGRVKAKALDNLDLTIEQGEIFGLLGPNGSGKTTTLKLLLGLLFPTSGSVRVLGSSPRHVANKQRIGFLPEESYLYPYHNAEETLYFYGKLFDLPRDICKKRVHELLEMVGLLKIRKRPIKEYSKGMARRIGLAQALINDPELVFLDEPTSGLDPIASREVKDLVLQLKKHGKTVLLCSHLLADVEDICDKIAILYGGKLQAMGTVQYLLSQPTATQLTIAHLSDQVQKQLLSWLSHNGVDQVQMSTPKERLETFFLRVIETARHNQIATSGAEAGKPADDFFSNAPAPDLPIVSTKNQIIESLLTRSAVVQGKSDEASVAQEQKATEALQTKNALLERLVGRSDPKDLATAETVAQQANAPEPVTPPVSPKTTAILANLLQPKKEK